MSDEALAPPRRHVAWLYTERPATTLDAATWLDTTRELRQLGWHVTLVAPGPAGRHRIRGTEVFCIPRPEKYLVRQIVFHLRFLWLVLRQGDPVDPVGPVDIILFNQMSAPWIFPLRLVWLFTRRRRPLLVMDTRTLPMEDPSQAGWKAALRRFLFGATNRAVVRWADGQTAITPRIAQALKIPASQLWGTWPSGASLEQFAPAQETRRWPQAGEPIELVYAGALDSERNLMALCRAVERVGAEGLAFRLSLLGDGPQRAELAWFAEQTAGRIRVLPPVPHDQVRDILACSHIGTLPFLNELKFQVSSPIKLFEYMASGLPVLATRVVCHTDVVGDGQYVFWAEDATVEGIATALRAVWRSRASLPEMGRAAAQAAESWTWRASAAKLKAALEYGLNR